MKGATTDYICDPMNLSHGDYSDVGLIVDILNQIKIKSNQSKPY